VRPNSGRIEPGRNVEIQVLLQTMKEDPPLDARCKDKFLVQSVAIPSDTAEGLNVTQIWSGIEQTNKSSIQEKKIRVVFLPADGQQHQSNGPSSSAASVGGMDNSVYHEDQPPSYSSPNSPQAVTPQRSAVGPTSTFDEKPEGAKSRGDAVNSAYNPAQSSGIAAAVSNAIPTSQDDVRRQLEDAKATISRLQEQATSGLRQRNVVGSGEKSSSQSGLATKTGSAGGVSVPIVALLCLLCFLIAYFFF
jgi:hypothetical protein